MPSPDRLVPAHQGDWRAVKIVSSQKKPVGPSLNGSPRMFHIGAGQRHRSRARTARARGLAARRTGCRTGRTGSGCKLKTAAHPSA